MANTPNLNLEEPAHGTPNWDTPLNSNFGKIDAGVIVNAPVADQAIVGAFKLSVSGGAIAVNGVGLGSVAGAPSLADFNVADGDSDWVATFRSTSASAGEVLTIDQGNLGDITLANTDSSGNSLNRIILRGVANGSAVRFGPNTTNGIAVTPAPSTVTIDGVIELNFTTGAGVVFASIGGGTVAMKPANFSTDTPTQLLPDADGTVGVKVTVPSTATSAGVVGMWAADASFAYFCTSTNVWRRVAIAAW